MFFLNLSMGEFLTLLSAVGGFVTALYLLDKSKRKKVVSTLRFWTPALSAQEMQSRRRMNEPWSLILQLLGLLLVLLAIAQLQWGSKRWQGRDHVLLLDTSAWSAEQNSRGTILDEEKSLGLDYLAALPTTDRVMLVRADGLTSPITPFTNDRALIRSAIRASVSQASALNWEQALAFAIQAQSWTDRSPGEIAYIGTPMLTSEDRDAPLPSNLRIISSDLNRDHVGIRHLAAKRDQQQSNGWNATVTLKNFGTQSRTVKLETRFGGTHFSPRVFSIAPGREIAAEYSFVTGTAGELVSDIAPTDALPSDQEVRLRLPQSGPLQVAVYTSRPQDLRPLLEANHRLIAHFISPAEYSPAQKADVVVLDGFIPHVRPSLPTLWIGPPRQDSPIPVKGTDTDAVIKNWQNETVLGAGLHSKETHIATTEIFESIDGDIPVASVGRGPIIVARESGADHPRFGVIGFDPLQGQMKFQVTTPILFANFLQWLSPESFRTLDLSAGSVGAATVTLDPKENTSNLHLFDDRGLSLPFTIHAGTLQFFTSEPNVVHLYSAERERIFSLTLPEVGDTPWNIPAAVMRGIPRRSRIRSAPVDLWKWLALAGLGCFLAEWILFGQQRRSRRLAATQQKNAQQLKPELVAE